LTKVISKAETEQGDQSDRLGACPGLRGIGTSDRRPSPDQRDAEPATMGPAGADGTYGFAFTVNHSETIHGPGVYDSSQDGLAGGATVGIWDYDNGSLFASVQISSGTV
jgi:hypothetical protein